MPGDKRRQCRDFELDKSVCLLKGMEIMHAFVLILWLCFSNNDDSLEQLCSKSPQFSGRAAAFYVSTELFS